MNGHTSCGSLRIGVVGAGRMGGLRARLLAEHPEVTEVLITDPQPEAVRTAVGPGIEPIADIDRMFERRPNALVVSAATPNHAALVRRAIDERVPCFCEKPPALELAETRSLCDRVSETKAVVQVGFPAPLRSRVPTAEGARREGRCDGCTWSAQIPRRRLPSCPVAVVY